MDPDDWKNVPLDDDTDDRDAYDLDDPKRWSYEMPDWDLLRDRLRGK